MQPNIIVNNDILDNSDDENEDVDASLILKKLRLSNKKNLLIAHLNINSIRNKLEALKCLISKNIDILIIAETKIDETIRIAYGGYNDGKGAVFRKDTQSIDSIKHSKER